jgi:hypothetical protein
LIEALPKVGQYMIWSASVDSRCPA